MSKLIAKYLPKPMRDALKARRQASRDRLRERYARPLEGRGDRLRAWASMMFVDHGFFRYVYLNRHRVGAGAYRSAQPGPRHIRRAARDGVRTVINLRGGKEFGSYPLEREACARAGVAFEEITLRSREAPSVAAIEQTAELLERVAYPVLFHCKSGADRAGLMSALYLLLREGATPQEAAKQLSPRFGHLRQGKTGVLDAFIDAYTAAYDAAAARGERLGFMEWVRSGYDPKAVTAAFKASGWGSFVVDQVLRRE
ncbi:MAG: tyrosine-protein phosphatase [Rhodobacteraceae bacterium]|nr:tyrosine-protein phosphatase [Paracoccaceae bacterium]